MMGLSTLSGLLLALVALAPGVQAVPKPVPAPQSPQVGAAASSFWLANLPRRGSPAYGNPGFQVYRNVKDFGAVGDGSSDDTNAINAAIAAGGRCGQGCDSQTTTPALVYFPPGTYIVSAPIVLLYYTQLVGDPLNLPVLKASAGFQGMAVIDADPYVNGVNFYTNQNNFYRQIRNFVIDLTGLPFTTGTGIHWQVAQATSLQNLIFNMRTDGGNANVQQGIFMDNGSGGTMTDLTFNGGKFGAFLGSQQFTTKNMTFNGCQTAIFMNWNWAWTFQDININNCGIGIDMANVDTSIGGAQTVGSILLLDSKITNTPIGVSTVYNPSSSSTNGTLVLDNVDMTQNVPVAVSNAVNKAAILPGNQKIASFLQGKAYANTGAGRAVQSPQTPITKPAALLNSAGKIVARNRPQYQNVPAGSFISVKSRGAVGNGVADDTRAIQAIFDSAGPNDIIFFDHGAYVVTDTVRVPKNIKITGEIWPLIMAGGSAFSDQNNPKVVFQVGQPGDVGVVEISDLIFETLGPQPGAILMEWNVAGTTPGDAALFDVHFRIGGSAGTQLQSGKCSKNPLVIKPANPACFGAFLLLHVTATGSGYFDNTWWWVADHELDNNPHDQIDIFNGRGVLVEATKGTWFWGTASEHSVLYNYQLSNAQNVFMGLIQTETAYFQGNPDANTPFTVNAKYKDPNFATWCAGQGPSCARTLGVRITDSSDVFIYGAGLYSFFDNYNQDCVKPGTCQQHMVDIQRSNVAIFGLSTKASVNMVTLNNAAGPLDRDNRNNFCATLAVFQSTV